MKRPRFQTLWDYLQDLDKRGQTQAQFAAKLGISAAHLSGIKRNKTKPSLSLAKRLADECGIPIESFLGEAK